MLGDGGVASPNSEPSWPPWLSARDGQPLMLPSRDWLLPLAHLPAALSARVESKRGSDGVTAALALLNVECGAHPLTLWVLFHS